MARVIITSTLKTEMLKKFKKQAEDLFRRFKQLEDNPHQGKVIGSVSGTVIKELKEGKYRFYCITDGHQLKFGTQEELANLLIKFVRMSDKKNQQKTIDEIKHILRTLGFERF